MTTTAQPAARQDLAGSATSNSHACSPQGSLPKAPRPSMLARTIGSNLRADQVALKAIPTPTRLRVTLRMHISETTNNLVWAAHIHESDDTFALWSGATRFHGDAEDRNLRYFQAAGACLDALTERLNYHFGPTVQLDLHSSQTRMLEYLAATVGDSWTVQSTDPHISVLRHLEALIGTIKKGPSERHMLARELARTHNDRKRIIVATDGSVGHGRSSCAFVADTGDFDARFLPRVAAGRDAKSTAAELHGIALAIRHFAEFQGDLVIKCDSTRAIELATIAVDKRLSTESRWNRSAQLAVLNAVVLSSARSITFQWVRGHNGDPLNEIADDMAVKARRHGQAKIGYEDSIARIRTATAEAMSQFMTLAA